MKPQENTELEHLVEQLGFDPYQLSDKVRSCGEIAQGPYEGCMCVFTEHTNVITELYRQPNFIDAKWGGDVNQPNTETGLIYLFRSTAQMRKRKTKAIAS